MAAFSNGTADTEREVAGARAEIEHGAAPIECAKSHQLPTPEAVDPKTEHVVGEVVAASNAGKHITDLSAHTEKRKRLLAALEVIFR